MIPYEYNILNTERERGVGVSKLEKLRKKFFSKPIRNDMTFEEIEKLARAYGCKVGGGGKHPFHVADPRTGTVIPIPTHGNTVGEAYIKQLRDLFEKIENLEEE